ncbi:uncharacterized protein ccdc141 [Eucyclogobius newberryi]|uniref:uncharacterized protein ccdc141 n=1 Tax=Eucyclogobius newberryi TaxID=166745 RepID=UPI003B5C394D
MTKGRTEETCEGQRKEASEGDMKKPLSVTALSTIAVHSGQTQIVVSVLKSGSSVHLQLVHVEPGLCEIGLNLEHNQTLISEQKKLLEKLQKHEGEVLLSVEKKRVEQRRQRQDGWVCEERSAQEKGVYRAMEKSLREGWALLLRLLDRRLHALTLAADFYCTVLEFSAGIEHLEDLEITADELHKAQLTYTSIRRDILGKSLQLLGISSDLLKKLRELQTTEALQRQGHVLQEGEEVDQESSQCSCGPVQRVEQMVEALQDRRRTVDHEVKLQIQQAQNFSQTRPHDQGPGEKEDWTLSLDTILAQNPLSLSETKFDVEKYKIPPELPQVTSNPTEKEDDRFASDTDLASITSNETLDQTCLSKFAEEETEDLRIESRMGEREPTPKCRFQGSQDETTNKDTSKKLLKALAEELKQELTREEFVNIEPVSDVQLDNASISNDEDCYLEIRLDQQAEEDVFIKKTTSKKNSKTTNDSKKQLSDTKFELLSRSLPVLTLASLKPQPKWQETKDFIVISSTQSELEQECESIGESSLNCDLSTTSKEFLVLESDVNDKRSTNLEAKPACQLLDAEAHHIDSSLDESQDGKFKVNSNLPKSTVSTIKQVSKENLTTISDSNQESQARLEVHSRSLPIFNLVPTKLQPKLQKTHLFNINANETPIEEKQKSEANKQFAANIQSNQCTLLENIKESNNVEEVAIYKKENTKEIYFSSNLNEGADLDKETGVKSDEQIQSLTDTNEAEQDLIKSDNFSQRFKHLQSKWQEKDHPSDNSTTYFAPKFEPLKTRSVSFNVKNVNVVANSEEHPKNIFQSEEKSEIAVENCNVGDNTIKTPAPEEHLEELLVHKREPRPIVETIVKVENTMVEKYEFKLEHSTAELKQEEAKIILHLEEIQKLKTLFDQLADKVSAWLDGCSSVLSVSSHPGPCFSEAQHSLNTHVQLQAEAQTADVDAESMMQILDQLRCLCPGSPGASGVNPKLSVRAEVILKDLNAVNTTIQSNLQLLQPYVIFLQTAEEVQVDFEHLRRTYAERPEVEEADEEARWQTALQKFFTAQVLGNTYTSHVSKMMVPELNQEFVADEVMKTMERLKMAKDEVEELHRQYQTQMHKLHEDQLYCLKYRERLGKTVADLQSVSELLDSCTVIDLGSEPHTSRLTQQFTQARPHFTQLDTEANFLTENFETVRRLRQKHGVRIREQVTEEDVSALLDLHLRLKQKIEESESILELSSSLHLINKQLEEVLESEPTASGQTGCAEEKLSLLKEQKEQIGNLFNRASNLNKDICEGIRNCSVSGFRVEQFRSRLRSVDARCVSWLSETARSEEALLREMKSQALLKDIHQLRDSFKDLKKRFGNLKFNYLKRNDRGRNIKAMRNQLQQVDMYEDKLQGLKSRLQTTTARMHSEVKEWGGARELEDLLNELHRQMGECERNVREHHKTLDMTCTLQEAMDEYQFWCEEASGTISRVTKFSSECRAWEAVSALYRQFEKFVWPTVPQQEERISQITELATRLHGAEEGRRYIEKTVSKHSEMVTAIRKLSDGLLELETKLKLESLKQKDEEEVLKESIKQKDTEMTLEESKDQEDNRTAHEAAEMYELKETGHTPELSNKHDGKEIPARRHSFNKKPPLQKSRTQDTDRQATSSFFSTHTFSLSCSPLESNRQVYAIISQSQPGIPTQAPPSPRNAKREEKDTAEDSLLDPELHPQHDVQSEDSLSADEYDCPSPDDISLPPLAETPESILVQSDLEEGVCFSSQHSHRSQAQSGYRESRESNLQSGNRVRTESGTFVPSPVTIPISAQVQAEFTTAVRSITNEENSITPAQAFESKNIPPQPSRSAEPTHLVHTHEDKNAFQNVIFTTSSTHVAEKIPNLPPDSNLPKSFPVCQSRIHQEIICLEVTKLSSRTHRSEECKKSQSDHILDDIEVQSVGKPRINDPTVISHSTLLHNEEPKPASYDSKISKGPAFPYDDKSLVSDQGTDTVRFQESSKCSHDPSSSKKSAAVSLGCLTTTIKKETQCSQSSMTTASLVRGVTNPVSEETFSNNPSRHQNVLEDLKSTGILDIRDILGHDNLLHEQSIDCKDELTSRNEESKEVLGPKSVANNVDSPPQEFIDPSTQESDSINHSNPSSNKTSNTKQNHQTVDSFHETSTQQCVHDCSFSAQLGATPLPEAKAQALAQPANMHVIPSFASHQLLTPDQDPDICQPCTIREEITLTPQIKGPSRPPHAQDESSCFTKPVSKATVMEGSPVTLEVEVTAQPEPTLTWCKDDREEEEHAIVEKQICEERSAVGRALCETMPTAGAKRHKHNTDDGGLAADVYDIIMADWQTWFGTLCFLLWLLFLIIV